MATGGALGSLPAETFLFQALLKLQDEFHVPVEEIQNSIQSSYSMLAEFNKVNATTTTLLLSPPLVFPRLTLPPPWSWYADAGYGGHVHGLRKHAPRSRAAHLWYAYAPSQDPVGPKPSLVAFFPSSLFTHGGGRW
jgi:hypothetical protein